MEFIATGVPFTALPIFDTHGGDKTAADKIVHLKHFGSGRVVLLDYPGDHGDVQGLTPNTGSYSETTDLDYEYYQSLVAKAVLWAAKKVPPILFRDFTPNGKTESASLENIELSTRISSHAQLKVDVKLTVRDEENAIEYNDVQEILLPVGDSRIRFTVPHLRAGVHFADFLILNGEETINWGTIAFNLQAQPMIQRVILNKSGYDPGDEVLVRMELSTPIRESMSAKVLLKDSYERVIASRNKYLNVGESAIEFDLPLDSPVSRWIDVVAELVQGEKTLHRVVQGAPVRIYPKERDVLFIMWSHADFQYLIRQVNRILAVNGVDAKSNVRPGALSFEALSRDNLMGIPYMTRFSPSNSGPGLVREPCLNDPVYRNEEKETLERITREIKPFAPVMYTLGDENYLGGRNQDFCFSEHCIRDFHHYLKAQYESLDALNQEWGTQFSEWSDVAPDTLDRSSGDGNFSRWIDHRMHMDGVFMNMHSFGEDAIQNVDPGAIVGADGESGAHPFSGKNYWIYPRVCKYLNIYPEGLEALEQARSFAAPGTRLGTWYGGYVPVPHGFHIQYPRRSEEYERYHPWWQVLMMHDIPAWFTDYPLAGFEAGVSPDLRLYDCLKWTAEEIRELKRGVGKLLLNSQRLHDGIAIHFSRASQLASYAMPGFGDHLEIERSFIKIVEDQGLQFNWVSYEQVENGMLRDGDYKVLLLPCSMALSEKEVAEIRNFVSNGGMVIADVRPGIMDRHGKVLESAQLNDLLGIELSQPLLPPREMKDMPIRVPGAESGGAFMLPHAKVHPYVKLITAVPMATIDGIPLVTVNKFGNGQAVYLNFSITEYWRERHFVDWGGLHGIMKALLKSGKVEAAVNIDLGNIPHRSVEVVRFQDGGIQYVTLLSDEQPIPEEVPESVVRFPFESYVYDVRKGEFLGFKQEIRTKIIPARAQVYALSPYKVEGITVQTEAQYTQGDVVDFDIVIVSGTLTPRRHCVRIDVIDPAGNAREWYGTNLFVEHAGSGSGKIPLAENEMTGAWTIRARDITSGEQNTASFTVLPRE